MADDIVKKTGSFSSLQPLYALSRRILVLGPELLDIVINSQRDKLHYQFSVKMYGDTEATKPGR